MSRSLSRLAAAVALPVALSACLDSGVEPFELVANNCSFAFSFDTTTMTKTATGLFYRDITAGTGVQVESGDEVAVYYTGWLPSGSQFDSATPQNSNPLTFEIGAREVIPGFEQGVTGMKVGGCRQIVIPPSLGYGATPNGPIPGNSTLVFEVSLVGQR